MFEAKVSNDPGKGRGCLRYTGTGKAPQRLHDQSFHGENISEEIDELKHQQHLRGYVPRHAKSMHAWLLIVNRRQPSEKPSRRNAPLRELWYAEADRAKVNPILSINISNVLQDIGQNKIAIQCTFSTPAGLPRSHPLHSQD